MLSRIFKKKPVYGTNITAVQYSILKDMVLEAIVFNKDNHDYRMKCYKELWYDGYYYHTDLVTNYLNFEADWEKVFRDVRKVCR